MKIKSIYILLYFIGALSVMLAFTECSTKLELIGSAILDSGYMQKTRCYENTNRLVKKYAKKYRLVYQIVPSFRDPMFTVLWYFDQNNANENLININIVDDDGIWHEYQYKYPYDLQWLRNIRKHEWPDSLLTVTTEKGYHPKDFRKLPNIIEYTIADDKAVVYDSGYKILDMPKYKIAEKYSEQVDSLSPIYKTYHESYKQYVYPIVDSILADKPEVVNYWLGY